MREAPLQDVYKRQAFIEFAGLSSVQYIIEMERPGERMKITGSCNVVELVREFWRR